MHIFAGACASLGYTYEVPGATFNVSWVGGLTGFYGTSGNWSGGVVPNNGNPTATSFYNVTINRAAGALATVNISPEILNLTIGLSNTLNLNDGMTLSLIGADPSGPCTISNSGTISISATSPSSATLNLAGTATSLGGGTVFLENGVVTGTGTVEFSGGTTRIEGHGLLGNNALAMIFNGFSTIEASGGILNIDPSLFGNLVNNSTLVLHSSSGTIQLSGSGGGAFNNNGTMNISSGVVDLMLATISGGTITSGNAIDLQAPAGQTGFLTGVTLTATNPLNVQARAAYGGTLALGGTIVNNCNIVAGTSTGTGTASVILSGINQTVTLNGTGTLDLGAQSGQTSVLGGAGGGTLVNNSNIRSLDGTALLGNNQIRIVNNGTINGFGGTLDINPSASGLVNSGLITGDLSLNGQGGGSFLNTTGTIAPGVSNVVRLINGALVSGGTVSAVQGSRVEVTQLSTISGSTLFTTGFPSGLIGVPGGTTGNFAGVNNLGILRIESDGTGAFSGTNTNIGSIEVTAGDSNATLAVSSGGAIFSGSGTIFLSSTGAGSAVISGVASLTNNSTISGFGLLGNDAISITNNSMIVANVGSQTLNINPGPGGLVNTGTILSTAPSFNTNVLVVLDGSGGGSFNNSTGTLAVVQGSPTFSASMHVTNGGIISGGNLTTTGSFILRQNSSVVGSTLHNGSVTVRLDTATFSGITVASPASVIVEAATGNFLGNISNDGRILISAQPGGAGMLSVAGAATFSGTGSIDLQSFTPLNTVVGGSGTLTNANRIISSTSTGTALLGNGQIAIQNSGSILALGGILTIDPAAGAGMFTNTGTMIFASASTTTFAAGKSFDTLLGRFQIDSGATVNGLGTMNAGSIQLNGRLNQTGNLTAGAIAGTGSLTLNAATTSVSATHVRIASVSSAGALTIPSNGTDSGVSRLQSAPVFTGGKMDLTNNDLVVDYTTVSPLTTIKSQIATAYNGGAWTGGQLTSSLANAGQFALGYAEASAVFSSFPANFSGQSVDNTTVLVRFTRYGDADLSGNVNLNDFNRLAANFGGTNKFWSDGDFNYDMLVNLSDFNLLAANFGLSASPAGPTPEDWSALASVVPEPTSLVIGLPFALLMRRRIASVRGIRSAGCISR